MANFLRKPYGPGWALVGDSGSSKNPITAQGIMGAFRDAESLAIALNGARSYHEAMDGYQRCRDERALPMYEFTTQLATLEPLPRMRQLLGAIHGNQQAMDGLVRINAGTTSPGAVFAPDNIGRNMAGGEAAGVARAS